MNENTNNTQEIANVAPTMDNVLALASKAFGITTGMTSETVGDLTTNFYEFQDTKKGKDGKEVTTTIQIRHQETALALSHIDLFSGMAKISILGFVGDMARIDSKEAKKACGGSVVDLVAKIHKEYSRTTLNMYRRIGLMFFDKSQDGYHWRPGIPSSVSVNNLSVVLALASKKKDLEECSDKEIEKLYQDFYAKYIATGEINLTTTQAELKKQVKTVNSIIDGESKEKDTQDENDTQDSQDSQDSQDTQDENDTQDTQDENETQDTQEKKFEKWANSLSEMSEYYKDNKEVVKAIANLIKVLKK